MPSRFSSLRSPRLDRRDFGRGLVAAAASLACPLIGSIAAHAADAAALAPDIKAIKDRGELIVAMTSFDSPPFYYAPHPQGTGQPAPDLEGSDVTLARDIAQLLDVKLTINRQAPSYNAVVDLVTHEQVDVAISKLSMTTRRAVMVQFTQPTIELRHALLVNRIALVNKSPDGDVQAVLNRDFDGKIGVIARSSYAETAKQVFAKAKLHEFAAWEAVVDAVDKGEVDLAYRDELEVKKLMRLRPELHLNLRSALITDIKDSIAVALPSRSSQLLAVINVILAQRSRLDANQLLDRHADIFQAA